MAYLPQLIKQAGLGLALLASLEASYAVVLPQKAELRYVVKATKARIKLGVAQVNWTVTGEKYVLQSAAKSSGFISVFKNSQIRYLSQGLIRANTLLPNAFSSYRDKNKKPNEQAAFDWVGGRLAYGKDGETKIVAIKPMAQDAISFVYQAMALLPFKAPVTLQITTGKKVEEYTLESAGEEHIDVPFADELRTLHIRTRPQNDGERTDIWFASDYQFVPVKIRQITSQGDLLEQTLTHMNINGVNILPPE